MVLPVLVAPNSGMVAEKGALLIFALKKYPSGKEVVELSSSLHDMVRAIIKITSTIFFRCFMIFYSYSVVILKVPSVTILVDGLAHDSDIELPVKLNVPVTVLPFIEVIVKVPFEAEQKPLEKFSPVNR